MANNTGTFFNVNDNDGIPLVGVSTNGKVMINHLYGNCLIGSTSVTGTASQPLQVTGGGYFSGNLGIGVTNPTAKLDVSGGGISCSGWSNNNSGTSGGMELGWDGTQTVIQSYDRVNAVFKPILYSGSYHNFLTGSVGIGTTGPDNLLHLSRAGASYLQIQNTTAANSVYFGNSSGNGIIQVDGANSLNVITNSTERLRIDPNGNLGIGTTNPTSKLHVVGGDIRVGIDTSQGIILTSQNGTKYRLIVSNAGVLSTVSVP